MALLIFSIIFISLAFASFTSVLRYRIEHDLSIFKPARSFCPECQTTLYWWHNIPVISYLILKGRCYFNNCKISLGYLSLELSFAAGMSALLIYLHYLGELGALALQAEFYVFILLFLALSSILVALALIDYKHKLIPHSLSYSGILIAMLLAATVYQHNFWDIIAKFGLGFYVLDMWGYLLYKFYARQHQELFVPRALTLNISFLKNKPELCLNFYLLVFVVLFMLAQYELLFVYCRYLGLAYLFLEIIWELACGDLSLNLALKSEARARNCESEAEISDISSENKSLYEVAANNSVSDISPDCDNKYNQLKDKYLQEKNSFKVNNINFSQIELKSNTLDTSKQLKTSDEQVKTAWGGGDTVCLVLLLMLSEVNILIPIFVVALSLQLVLTLLTRLNQNLHKKTATSGIPLGPVFAVSGILAMIVTFLSDRLF